MTNVNPNDWLLATGVKSAAFKTIGDHVVGHIMRQPEVVQQRDINTGAPKTWNDGSPMMQMRVVLMTEERDPSDPEDSGERAIYIKGNMQKAVALAVRQAGATGLEVGGKLMVTYKADGAVTQRGFNPPKVYEAKYRAPEVQPVPVPEPPPQAQAADPVPF